MTRRLQTLNNWHVFYILVFITLATSISSAFLNPELADKTWWSGFLQNFSTEMMGAIATFALFELVVGSRNEMKNLIIQMRNANNATALSFLNQINTHGWLENGALKGMNLSGSNLQKGNFCNANLQGVNFKNSNLRESDLTYANLQDIDLRGSDLQASKLLHTNLQKAYLKHSNLQDTHIEKVNLKGAIILVSSFQNALIYESNLEQAQLLGCNLSNATINKCNLKGAALANSNLKGANLFTNLEHLNMFGVECDENTTLPDGTKWTADVDWSQFGAVVIEDRDEWQAYKKEHGLDKDNQ